MRIIKPGQLPEDKIFRGTCSNCKTQFECTKSEGSYEYDQRERSGFLRVKCPLCEKPAVAYERNDGASVPYDQRSSGLGYFDR